MRPWVIHHIVNFYIYGLISFFSFRIHSKPIAPNNTADIKNIVCSDHKSAIHQRTGQPNARINLHIILLTDSTVALMYDSVRSLIA